MPSGIEMMMKALGVNPEKMMQESLLAAEKAGIGTKLKAFADQVDRIERKLDIIIDHFGLVDEEALDLTDAKSLLFVEGNNHVGTS